MYLKNEASTNYLAASSCSMFLFECLFYVRPSDFCSILKVRHVMGALIRTSIEYTEKVVLESRENRTRAQSNLSH